MSFDLHRFSAIQELQRELKREPTEREVKDRTYQHRLRKIMREEARRKGICQ